MSKKCNICNVMDIEKIYQFTDRCITSICSEKTQNSNIYFCHNCTQVMTDPLEDIGDFYSDTYNINAGSEEEDQLLKIVDGQKIYRYTYQAETLIKTLSLNIESTHKILDFGAAKASTLRKVCEKFPKISPYVYDVSENYRNFWDKFIKKEAQFINTIDADFEDHFDIVCSFFMLEHVVDPVAILKKKYSLLKEGGTVYFVVPNLYKNTADLLVLDHVNHFSRYSLQYMMESVGFIDVVIDENINDGWFVVTGVKKKAQQNAQTKMPIKIDHSEINQLFLQAKGISGYWKEAFIQVKNFNTDQTFAIYGAGFYGSYIALNLKPHLKPTYFVDQNPFLQGGSIHGIEVISPNDMPEDIKQVLVGINPLIAEVAMDSVSSWKNRDINFTYLFKK